ncbi:MAG: putative sulfate exporter family transporter [Planctomycetales bacterium]|nr:putative sulfate exporter family transporter [Planctomycetales bacterium]
MIESLGNEPEKHVVSSGGLETAPSARGLSEDWTAVVLGLCILILGLLSVQVTSPPENISGPTSTETKTLAESWLADCVGKPGKWNANPGLAFYKNDKSLLGSIIGALLVCTAIGAVATWLQRNSTRRFIIAFPLVFVMSLMAYVLSSQIVIANYNLEFALWALLVGLIVCNTCGTPLWLKPAVRGELYIKTGLVLLGAEVLFGRLLALGVPGIFVSWVVTPIVLISTYVFGQRVLKIPSRSLNMVVSADMSVCGVSAAIATAAACRAKKEELSLAIGLSLSFTVLLMIVMPIAVETLQLDPVVGGAWIGGTVDSTGAVAASASSEYLGDVGLRTATTVKMIQNILIGIIAFGVAAYWTRWVDTADQSQQVGPAEIWRRFPKFVLGFLAASILCSILFAGSQAGELRVSTSTDAFTKGLRGWLFCLAFVCIGLETNFRELFPYFRSGKPLILYLSGQALNLILTLAMAYLMYGVVFKT